MKISVLMAINSFDEYFEDAYLSIINQSFEDFDFHIIANGMSEHQYAALINRVQGGDNVCVHRLELSGLANALNYGLIYARGEFIARMDADDIAHPLRLESQYYEMIGGEGLDVLGTKVELIDSKGIVLQQTFKFYETNKEIRRVLPYRNPLVHPSLMIRRSALLSVGGYRYGHMSEDHELFIRLARNPEIRFKNVNKSLLFYRRHQGQITSVKNAKKNYAEISGFLFTEFLLTKNILYIVGIIAVHPRIRSLRHFFKKIMGVM
ncbi:glycosyltransferase [Polynucleobacter sp. VK25]|uniref:glycosyltransferase n=1 Tax=Polynucleobacter sp. VK25 TaxID=1758398 RepID=UPI001BFEDFE5|nr:glycosyltransferase [Polynucleobacter sp. VK25]QWD68645.1 glycosyltransferase [Polynucleobacter sp. VK25]